MTIAGTIKKIGDNREIFNCQYIEEIVKENAKQG